MTATGSFGKTRYRYLVFHSEHHMCLQTQLTHGQGARATKMTLQTAVGNAPVQDKLVATRRANGNVD